MENDTGVDGPRHGAHRKSPAGHRRYILNRRRKLSRFIHKEPLLDNVPKELKKYVPSASLNDGPFYLVTSKRSVLIQSEAKKAISSKPEGAELISVSQNITEEAAKELVPGNHKRWDTDEELDIRLENNGRKNYEDISSGVCITLEAGDLLAFSANIIHRGLYGMDRLALDVLFCGSEPSLTKFVGDEYLPDQEILRNIEDPSAFLNTMNLKADGKAIHTTSV